MKIKWKTIIFLGLAATLVLTAFEFISSSAGEIDLAQYEVEKVNPNIGTQVLDRVASFSDRIYTHSEDIGKFDN